MRSAHKPWIRGVVGAALWAVALVGLAAVFGLYRRPEFLVLLSKQIWTCF